MKHIRVAQAVLIAVASSAFAADPPWTRDALEGRLNQSADIRLADGEHELAEARRQQADARRGVKVFGSAGLADTREPVSDLATRSYQRMAVTAGLRIPLFASRDSERTAVEVAEAETRYHAASTEVARREARKALHYGLLEVEYGRLAQQVAADYLAEEGEVDRVLRARRQAGLLLESDRLELASSFSAARRNHSRAQVFAATAAKRVQMLTGLSSSEPLQLPRADLRTGCLTPERMQVAISDHPSLVQARRDLERAQRQHEGTSSAIEGGLVLSQSLTKDLGGPQGSSSYVGIDVQMPLSWRDADLARRSELRLQTERANVALERRTSELDAAVANAWVELESRRSARVFASERVNAAAEALRIAELRARRVDGDVLEKFQRARYELYRAIADLVEAQLAEERAKADILGLVDECPQATADAVRAETTVAEFRNLLRQSSIAMVDRQHGASADAAARKSVDVATRFGWYVWRIEALQEVVADADRWADFRQRSRLIRVSLTGDELKALTSSAAAERLRRLIEKLRSEGLRVEFLLGEPTWAMPAHRGELLEAVRRLSAFDADGFHLDLEFSQTTDIALPTWQMWLADTVREVSRTGQKPVGISVHPRDIAGSGVLRNLVQSGLSELTVMIYRTDMKAVVRDVDVLLSTNPDLRISVAQSIEPTLSPEESLASRGRVRAVKAWQEVARALSRHRNFGGVVVQSLETYHETKQ